VTDEVTGGVGLDLDAALADDEEAGGDLERGLEAALGDGEDPGPRQPRSFDFNRPHSISRVFEQNLRSICETLAKTATITITNLLRVNSLFEFKDLTLLPGGDYLQGLPNPTCVATATLHPMKGHALVYLDLGLCFTILKKLMGGAVEPEEMLREFTEIEQHIFSSQLQRLLDLLRDASARICQLEPKLVSLENNPNYLSGVAVGDTHVILGFSLKIDTEEGELAFALPLPGFESVRNEFDPEQERELRSPQEVQRDRRLIMDLIQGTGSELVVKLGELETSLDAVMALQEGDLLQLPQASDAPLIVEVEGKPVFLGEAGRIRQNRAVKLIQKLSEE
jgi:flagellar motor switch protein FliM